MEPNHEQRLKLVREAQQDKIVSTGGPTKKEDQEKIDAQTSAIMKDVSDFLDSIDKFFKGEKTSAKVLDKYKKFLSECIRKYLKADFRASKKYANLSHFSNLPETEKKILLQELVADFNEINGFLNSPEAADSSRMQPPETFYDIVSDPDIPDEYKNPGLLRRLAIHNISNPKDAISRVEANVKLLQEDPEIPEEYKKPGLLRQVAIHNIYSPKETIERIEENVKLLQEDPEIPEEYKKPGLLRRAAINNIANPKEAIKCIEANVKLLQEDPEIPEEYKKPGLLRHVATYYPENPKETISRIEENVKLLQEDPEIPEEYKKPGLLRQIAIYNITKPKDTVRRIEANVKALEADQEIPGEYKSEGLLQYVSIHNIDDPKKAIRRSMDIRKKLITDITIPEKIRNNASLMARISIRHPIKTKDYLLKNVETLESITIFDK